MGLIVAESLAKQGVHVILGVLHEERGKRSVEKMHKDGVHNAEVQQIDITDRASIEKCVNAVKEKHRSTKCSHVFCPCTY